MDVYPGTVAIESVAASDLVIGQCYFQVYYVDDDMLLPVMASLVYLGQGVDPDRPDHLFFQDLDSFTDLGPYPKHDEAIQPEQVRLALFSISPDHHVNGVYDLTTALISLQNCDQRRRWHASQSSGKS